MSRQAAAIRALADEISRIVGDLQALISTAHWLAAKVAEEEAQLDTMEDE